MLSFTCTLGNKMMSCYDLMFYFLSPYLTCSFLLPFHSRNGSKQAANSSDWWRSRSWRSWSDCSHCPGRFVCQVPHCTTVHEQKQGRGHVHHPRRTTEQKKCLRSARRHDRARRRHVKIYLVFYFFGMCLLHLSITCEL